MSADRQASQRWADRRTAKRLREEDQISVRFTQADLPTGRIQLGRKIVKNPAIKFYFGHIRQLRKLIEELDASGGDKAQKQKYLRDIVSCCSQVPLAVGTVAKYQVERAGLDWIDVSRNLIENGWAAQIHSTAVRLQAHFNLEARREAMSRVFGDDFARIIPILRQPFEPKSEAERYEYFREFLKTGLWDASFDEVLKMAASADSGLLERESQVYALADKMRSLYDFEENVSSFRSPGRVGIAPYSPGILSLAVAQMRYIINGLLEAVRERLVSRIFIILFLGAIVMLIVWGISDVALRVALSRRHDSPRIKQEQFFERRLGGMYGIVAKYEVEKLGLDWEDVSQKLTENGWADRINSTEVRLKANLDVTSDMMSEVFGDDFPGLFPVLRHSLYIHRGPRSEQEQDARRLSQVTQDSQARLTQYRRDQMRDMQRLSFTDRRRDSQERFMQDYQMRLRDLQHQ